MEVKRIFDLIDFTIENYDKTIAFAGKKSGKWQTFSSKEYRENADIVSCALMASGILRNDKIMMISNNRPEWNFVDIGIMQMGAVHVPVYPTINDEDLLYILNETESKIVFVSNNFLFNKVNSLLQKVNIIPKIYTFDTIEEAVNFQEFLTLGKTNPDEEKLKTIRESITEKDLATIIYTSGTTANPKGVMLSHSNLTSNFIEVSKTFDLTPNSVNLSYLPLCHVYERMLNYMYQYHGVSIYYAESLGGIIGNFNEVHPDVISTVPLLLEKIYANFLAKGDELKGVKKSIYKWALQLTEKYRLDQNNSLWYEIQRSLADKLVYKKWRAALGGRLNIVICGGAALQSHLLKAYWTARIHVLEGYGLTETSPVISNNNENKYKLGTIGKILTGVEVKIAEDGEILCKGTGLMIGYFKHPEMTAEVIDEEGWFHTGDIGVIEDEVFVKITGRKKDIFKTSSGYYISPEKIENQLKQSPFVGQALIYGANQNFLSALIVPDFSYVQKWCDQNQIEYVSSENIIKNDLLKSKIQDGIDEYNHNSMDTEQILKFKLLPDEWTIETGELTPKMSIKRNVVNEKFKNLIKEFYNI